MAVASGRRRTRRRRSEPTTRASKVMTLTSRRVPLASLAPAVQGEVRGDAGTMVTDVVLDTRKVVPGRAVLLRPRGPVRRPRPGRQGPRRRRGRPVRAAAPRPGSPPAAGRRGPGRAGPAGGGVLRPPLAPLRPGRGDRHQRQDHHHLHAGGDLPGRRPASRGCWAPSRCGSGTTAGRPSTPPPRPPTSSGCWPRWPTPACRRRPWRCPATAWPCTGSTAPASRRPSSPT